MAKILATRSESHPIDAELLIDCLPGHDVEVLEVPYRGLGSDAREELIEALRDREALFLRPGRVDEAILEAAAELELIAIHGSGYDRVDVEAATRHGVIVTHNPDAVWPGVVEHTFGVCFTLLRDLPTVFEETAAGKWNEVRDHPRELQTATLGVIGLGRIGYQVARVAAEGFGASVLGYDPYVDGSATSPIYPRYDQASVEALGVEVVGLDRLLEESDIVSLHAPKTEDTIGMIGESELEKLHGDFLINTARGGIIDEAALLVAVEADALAGVALDVLEQEPPDPEDPLLRSDRVLTTPHIAGISDGYLERAATQGAAKIRDHFAGELPANVLNPSVLEE